MTQSILVEIAPGELIDKITILEIKDERIADDAKRANVRVELATLAEARTAAIPADGEIDRLTAELKSVNEALWEIEDGIRDCDRAGDFGPRFVELARAVYRTNDRRAELKKAINLHLGSRLVEEKSYQPY
ncbi:MAG: DUF6165 family protein [Chromatiales bacterium]|jgi:hypothetical protein